MNSFGLLSETEDFKPHHLLHIVTKITGK